MHRHRFLIVQTVGVKFVTCFFDLNEGNNTCAGKIGIKCLADVCPWPMAVHLQSLIFLTSQTSNRRRRQKKLVEIFLNLPTFVKCNQDENLLEISRSFRRNLLARCLGIQVWIPVMVEM